MPAERSTSGNVTMYGATITGVSRAAIRVEFDEMDFWIPKSLVESGNADALEEGDKGITLSIPEWLAKDKGIEIE